MVNPSILITPNYYGEDKLLSIIPTDGSGDLVVTRATTATRVNSIGLIEVVPYNLLTFSNTFSNANWGKTSVTVTSGQSGYDGTSNAWLLASTTTPTAYLSQSVTVNVNSLFSVYLKKGTLDWAMFLTSGTTFANFDLNNGVLGSISNCTATIESVGNGWYKCTIKPSVAGINVRIYPANGDNTRTTTGNILIQNAQLEESTSAKEYFPTTDRLDVPRLDYTNSSCPSILVEPQRTNLLLNSVFNGTGSLPTSWADAFVTGTSAPAVSTKSTIGQAYTFTTSATRRVIVQLLNYVSGTTYSFSVYVENVSGSISVAEVLFFNGTGTQTFYKDGVLIPSSTPVVSGSRYTSIFVASATVTQQVRLGNGCTTTTTGSVRLSMPQLEVGSYATSYIPTIASTVTRNADLISKTGISSLIGQTEGAAFVDINVDLSYTQNDMRFINISDGTSTNWWFIGTNLSNQIRFYFKTGATTYVSQSLTLTSGRHKLAFAYKSNDYVAYVDGIQVHSLNSLIVGATSQIDLGNDFSGGRAAKQFINSAILWKERLSDAELELLTGNNFITYNEMATYLNYNIQ